jgi:hypothetical protein
MSLEVKKGAGGDGVVTRGGCERQCVEEGKEEKLERMHKRLSNVLKNSKWKKKRKRTRTRFCSG